MIDAIYIGVSWALGLSAFCIVLGVCILLGKGLWVAALTLERLSLAAHDDEWKAFNKWRRENETGDQ